MLTIVAKKGLLKWKTLGADSSTMEANAALRSIVRRDDGRDYSEFLTDLAKESGIETPTREELAHAVQHAVDMDTGAIVGATIQNAVVGDTNTIYDTLARAFGAFVTALTQPDAAASVSRHAEGEIVADKRYHSNDKMEAMASAGWRSYFCELNRGERNWKGKEEAGDATYGDRERMKRAKGKGLMRKRGELIERSLAHTLESGAMRRAHLRGHGKIMMRYHLHAAAFSLGLVLRSIVGAGTPKGLAARAESAVGALAASISAPIAALIAICPPPARTWAEIGRIARDAGQALLRQGRRNTRPSSTGC